MNQLPIPVLISLMATGQFVARSQAPYDHSTGHRSHTARVNADGVFLDVNHRTAKPIGAPTANPNPSPRGLRWTYANPPGVHVEVERPRDIVMEALDERGEPQRIEADGVHARILQHEFDHLDGVLMLDRTSPEHRRAAVRALNAGESWRPASDEPEPVA
jgi:hypothetical protein